MSVQPAKRQIECLWMKAQAEKPTRPLNGKAMPEETKGHFLSSESIGVVAKLFNGVAERMPTTVGVQLKGEGIDHIWPCSVV